MSVVNKDYIKTYFPLWNQYFLDGNNAASETVLQNELDLAETELKEYINFPAELTPQVSRMVLIITAYRGFQRRHGDTEYQAKPRIVKDYEELITRLKDFRGGTASLNPVNITPANMVTVTSKPRLFNEWFNEPFEAYGENYV